MQLPDWPRAHGLPLFKASLRAEPQDFCVTEILGWDCSGEGEHDYLWVEKTNANTEWVARQLADFAAVPAKDVGYAGMKDRRAVTLQWFSVPRWNGPNWSSLDVEGVEVIDVQRHLRKLRRGAHRANSFRILLRGDSITPIDRLEGSLSILRQHGVPNYYGEQRFGRNGENLSLADTWAQGRRLTRNKRSIAISTVRSFVFNQLLAKRVQERNWDVLVANDLANLDGSGSVFAVEEIDDELRRRCAEMDVHPAAVLPGEGSNIEHEIWQAALDRGRVEAGSRSFRLPVPDLASVVTDEGLLLTFTLGRGAFATAVLRELCDTTAQS